MFYSSDGCVFNTIPASRLASIEVWKGNRTLDKTHVERITRELRKVQDLNADVFKILCILEDDIPKKYLYDGQHRQAIIKEYFASNFNNPDFDVLISEKICQDESEAIQLFKKTNTTKSMEWTNDPILVANTYIEAFTNEFNKNKPLKDIVVRTGKTKRPFLSIDTLRDKLIEKNVIDWKTTPQEFIQRCREINEQQVKELDSKNLMQKRAKELNFALGMLEFTWI
jgi:hypothetical protein